MSIDLGIYATRAITSSELAEAITLYGLRESLNAGRSGDAVTIERPLRDGFVYAATLEGPFAVEPEDLPATVLDRGIGIRVMYQLNVEGSSRPSAHAVQPLAREIARTCEGIVYDPQRDAVTWPPGGTRKSDAPRGKLVDLVEFAWFVRREDRPGDLAGALFDTIAARIPEALPRRFGTYEPPQHNLEEEGRDGFIRAFSEEESLFWYGKRPCTGGHTNSLSDESRGSPKDHHVGSVTVDFLADAFQDRHWRDDLVRLFTDLIPMTRAFVALASVRQNVHYVQGHVSLGPEATLPPWPAVRGEWLGIPPDGSWITWFGPVYKPLVETALAPRIESSPFAGGLLFRVSEEPRPGSWADRAPSSKLGLLSRSRHGQPQTTIPRELLMVDTKSSHPLVRDVSRAEVVPEGL